MSDFYVTREGYEKIKQEIDTLRKVKSELSREIGEAREQGDLTENVGYTAAKEQQAKVLNRIGELEYKLKNARILEETKINKEEIRIGATVTLFEESTNAQLTYTLAGSEEADPSQGKISVNSPLAQGLLGAKENDVLKVKLPAGEKIFRVIEVKYT
jgi:transcription elongation factor GreA